MSAELAALRAVVEQLYERLTGDSIAIHLSADGTAEVVINPRCLARAEPHSRLLVARSRQPKAGALARAV